MQPIFLQNEVLKLQFSSKGAELQSIQHINGLEYMWQADPAFWAKHSPVLFPIVGSLKEDTYFFDGATYHLPRHGFARERQFTVHPISPSEVLFTLIDDAESRLVYPFAFELGIRYTLHQNTLFCSYEVRNPGSTDLWFSVGGHPAFAVPLLEEENYHDYSLVFSEDEPLHRYKLLDGLISENREEIRAPGGILPLHPSLFYEDAIVLKHSKSKAITLAHKQHGHGWKFVFEGFPFLGIWAAKNAPFVCIEPWCGHADTVLHQQQLTNKPGIIQLKPYEQWVRSWSVTVY